MYIQTWKYSPFVFPPCLFAHVVVCLFVYFSVKEQIVFSFNCCLISRFSHTILFLEMLYTRLYLAHSPDKELCDGCYLLAVLCDECAFSSTLQNMTNSIAGCSWNVWTSLHITTNFSVLYSTWLMSSFFTQNMSDLSYGCPSCPAAVVMKQGEVRRCPREIKGKIIVSIL